MKTISYQRLSNYLSLAIKNKAKTLEFTAVVYYQPNINLWKDYRLSSQASLAFNITSKVQFVKLEKSKLAPFFTTVTSSEEVGVKKPNPKIFEYALSKANVAKQNSIMIGDCIDADVNGALNFGIDAIHFNENKIEIPNHIKQVNHLIELKNSKGLCQNIGFKTKTNKKNVTNEYKIYFIFFIKKDLKFILA